MQAVVLAAGKGVRLKPLTDNMPKAMVEISGKPVLERVLLNLSKAGITEVHLVVGYLKEVIEKRFLEEFEGMKINYFVQEKQLGTAHALSLVENFVKGNFLVVNADVLVDASLFSELAVVDEFDLNDGVIVCREVEDTWRYSCLKLEGDHVVGLVEKPVPGQEPSKTVNIGVYRFDDLIFEAIKEIELSPRGEFELVDAIRMLISAGGTVVAKKYSGFYAHIGDQMDLASARLEDGNSETK